MNNFGDLQRADGHPAAAMRCRTRLGPFKRAQQVFGPSSMRSKRLADLGQRRCQLLLVNCVHSGLTTFGADFQKLLADRSPRRTMAPPPAQNRHSRTAGGCMTPIVSHPDETNECIDSGTTL